MIFVQSLILLNDTRGGIKSAGWLGCHCGARNVGTLKRAKSICHECGKELNLKIEESCCYGCDEVVGSVNVRAASCAEERDALTDRYKESILKAKQRGVYAQVRKLEAMIAQQSTATIGLRPGVVEAMLHDDAAYQNYYEVSDGDKYQKGSQLDTINRTVVDDWLYQGYGSKLRYATLSLNKRGAKAYGPITIVISRVKFLERYASILEQNSYHFYCAHYRPTGDRRHPIGLPPRGYRSNWQDRSKVAVCKLVDQITPDMDEAALCDLILQAAPDPVDEEFIEVQIFKSFKWDLVDCIVHNDDECDPEDEDVMEVVLAQAKAKIKAEGGC